MSRPSDGARELAITLHPYEPCMTKVEREGVDGQRDQTAREIDAAVGSFRNAARGAQIVLSDTPRRDTPGYNWLTTELARWTPEESDDRPADLQCELDDPEESDDG